MTHGFNIFYCFDQDASNLTNDPKVGITGPNNPPSGWDSHGWFYISVRVGFFLWVHITTNSFFF